MKYLITGSLLMLSILGWGCSSSSQKANAKQPQAQSASADGGSGGLTPFQKKNGIGPITKEVKVGALDKELAAKGKKIFDSKCSSCHKLGQRYVGPDLKEVTSRRTPTYIMNMIMNPQGMTQKHPEARKLLQQFATQMANMHLKKDQARAVVEYFRSVNTNTAK